MFVFERLLSNITKYYQTLSNIIKYYQIVSNSIKVTYQYFKLEIMNQVVNFHNVGINFAQYRYKLK